MLPQFYGSRVWANVFLRRVGPWLRVGRGVAQLLASASQHEDGEGALVSPPACESDGADELGSLSTEPGVRRRGRHSFRASEVL